MARSTLERAESTRAAAAGRGPLVAGAAKLEVDKARAEQAASAFAWHQAMTKYRAALGEFAGE
jgi:hypothetical protein